ncbi:MAG TPA: cytochrome P450 [Acidimicrobiales bacterium]|jgi:cytochrome P450|nr:cytochrome P450 [Acidimicrobiales bacterium]
MSRPDVDEIDLATIDLTDLDRFAGGFPDDVFTRLRQVAPVWWHAPTEHTPDGVGFWVLSTHADVLAVAADAELFSSERAPAAEGGGTILQDLPYGFASGVLLNMMDDPLHHRIRRLVTPSVSPKALALMEVELRRRARGIVDAIAERGRCDFLIDVAVELPLQAVAALMGVPDDDRHDLMSWSNTTLDFEGRELGETNEKAAEAAASMAAYGSSLIEQKRKCPGDDIISVVTRARVDGADGKDRPLSDLELLMFFNLLVVAGSETTRNSIALGVAALIEHPDQLDALRRDRTLMPTAVEEILRWTSATLYNRRTATRDTDLHGHAVKAGDKVTLWWPSANRDESVFDDPFRFDIRRTPNPHLTFGYRSHYCMGANLARLEIRVILDELLDRVEGFELCGPVERVRTNKHAGVWHMPMTFRPRQDA